MRRDTVAGGLATGGPGSARGTDAGISRQPRSRWRTPGGRSWRAAVAVAAAALVLYVCYLRLSWTSTVSSDGASIALEAWDMLHGNWLLRGWTVPDVTFLTTEQPQYMLVEAVRGLTPSVVHLAAAMTYTLLVLLAGWLAKGRARGRAGLVRFLVASGIMLSPQPGAGAFILLLAPDHVGTQVPLLLIWLLLDRAPPRWWVVAVTGLALAWVQVGDRIAATVAVLPLVVVCAVRAYQRLALRREPVSAAWYELSLGAAALVSALAASSAAHLITRLHGVLSEPLPNEFAASASWPRHLALTAQGVLALFGADPTGRRLDVAVALAFLHLAGVALAAWAVCRALRRFLTQDLVVQILAVAVVINLAAYIFSTLPQDLYSTREIAAVLPCGAVLAGRLLADLLAKVRLLPAAGAVLLGYGAALGSGMLHPVLPAVGQSLAAWLADHHLSSGLASYAQANATTVASGGAIQLRQPDWHPGEAGPGVYASKSTWFDPRLHTANFVVSTRADGRPFDITYREVLTVFGKPARTYHYDSYTIWVWNTNLLRDLR